MLNDGADRAMDAYGSTCLSDFVTAVCMGREIEFHLKEHDYFIQPDYKNGNDDSSHPKYIIWDCENSCRLFSGSVQDLIDFDFVEGVTLQNSFSQFYIDYIL
ncbi:MAG: hypothetical protein IJX62_04745 [Clostridia bacterium]|nr:hypothetical protein [Clostridia bacterium]